MNILRRIRQKNKARREKKEKKFKSSYGAVTIFLTLILLPCMIFVCAFGDISRVMLSRSQAVAASDLALYSLMAHYDEDLKEWYGLVASVDNIDEFYDVTARYFTGMMSAAGLDENASDLFTAYISSLKTGKDFVDLLQVEVGSASVSAAPNAAVGSNPALIEDGIVEFMKYRGPVSIASRIYHRFGNIDAVGTLSDASENQPITEAKQEYATAEGEMMEELVNTYLALVNYNQYRIENGVPDMDKYQNVYGKHLAQIQEDLPKASGLIARYYSYSQSIRDVSSSFRSFSPPTLTADDPVQVRNPNDNRTYSYEDIGAEEEDDHWVLDASDLGNLLGGVDGYVNQINNAVANIANAYYNAGLEVPTAENDLNPVVYCMRFQELGSGDFDTVSSAAANLMTIYAKLTLAQTCTMPGKYSMEDPDWPYEVSNAISTIESLRQTYLSFGDKSSDFEKILAGYYNVAVSQGTVKSVKNRSYQFDSSYCGGSVTIDTFFSKVNEEFGTLAEQLEFQIGQVDTVLNGGKLSYHGRDYTAVSLTTLKAKIKEYTDAREDWGSETTKHDTKYAKEENEEYRKATSNDPGQNLAAAIKDADKAVEELRGRMKNIRGDLQTLKDALDSFTYGGKPVHSLDASGAISAAGTVMPTSVSGVARTFSETDSAIPGYNNQLISPTGTIYTPPKLDDKTDGNDPNIDVVAYIPELYAYMKKAFPLEKLDTALDAKDSFEKECEENDNKAKEIADESTSVDDSAPGKGKNLPETTGGNGFGVVTAIKALVDTIKRVINGNFSDFRDQMYVVEYAMDMFSYSTFNNEGRYHLVEAHEGEKVTSTQTYRYDKYNDEWNKDDPTELNILSWNYNQSLTNRQINANNNHANLGEIEYLLYGKEKLNDNVKAAYTDIFVIRETLNLVSGFANFWSPNNTTGATIESIAAFIQGITLGMVPIPLTKIIIIALLATCESAWDLKRLKAGVPVTIYKSSDKEWMFSISGDKIANLFDSANPSLEPVDENGLFYSDYIYIFMLMMAASSDAYKSMLLRIGDLIEANMTLGKGEAFDLESSMAYFQLTSRLRVKPLFLTLPVAYSMRSEGVDPSSVVNATDWCSYNVGIFRGYS